MLAPEDEGQAREGEDNRGYDGTQLVSGTLELDSPLRMAPPAALKLPERREAEPRDARTRRAVFSAQAFSLRSERDPKRAAERLAKLRRCEAQIRSHTESRATYRNASADYSLLAFSSRRAGRSTAEATAHLAQGIMADNVGEHRRAIKAYDKVLKLARAHGDEGLAALALNYAGVNRILMASAASGVGGEEGEQLLREAIRVHSEHLRVADDGGHFVAHSNLGLCLGMLGRHGEAAHNQQEALRTAIRIQSVHAQAIAVGNLGLLARRNGDAMTAQACMEQHLALTQSTNDATAEIGAWLQLAALADGDGRNAAAVRHYEQARSVAEAQEEIATLKRINCSIAMATAKDRMEGFFFDLQRKLRAAEP